MTQSALQRHTYDVLVIGAGGAGLRAAVEAREAGLSVAIICKSLFGKAHTVMAEGGAAASMGNVNDNDNWMVHFRDTMRGGKFLNHYRMENFMRKRRQIASGNSKCGERSLIAPKKERFLSATLVATNTHDLHMLAIAPV